MTPYPFRRRPPVRTDRPLRRRLRSAALGVALAGGSLLAVAAPAAADSTTSSNWAGYAAHRSGTSFREVGAEWRVPAVSCVSGEQTFSAMWVGLGGYSESSQALEQTGTESDCTSTGQTEYSAWYELVPSSSRSVALTVEPGQVVSASVTVNGDRVTISLNDLSTGHSFSRTITDSDVDVSSAEWIVEAPSECESTTNCEVLPLADFEAASFSDARAVTPTGVSGGIISRKWTATKIALASDASGFVAYRNGSSSEAQPSALTHSGTAFTVTYRTTSAQSAPSPGQFYGSGPSGPA